MHFKKLDNPKVGAFASLYREPIQSPSAFHAHYSVDTYLIGKLVLLLCLAFKQLSDVCCSIQVMLRIVLFPVSGPTNKDLRE